MTLDIGKKLIKLGSEKFGLGATSRLGENADVRVLGFFSLQNFMEVL